MLEPGYGQFSQALQSLFLESSKRLATGRDYLAVGRVLLGARQLSDWAVGYPTRVTVQALLAHVFETDVFRTAIVESLVLGNPLPHASWSSSPDPSDVEWILSHLGFDDFWTGALRTAPSWRDLLKLLSSAYRVAKTAGRTGEAPRIVAVASEQSSETYVQLSIDYYGDDYDFGPDGSVCGSGWAVTAADIDEIRIAIDGNTIGKAELGLFRPGLGDKFPSIINAGSAGFLFKAQSSAVQLATDSSCLAIIVEAKNGDVTRRNIPVRSWTSQTSTGSVRESARLRGCIQTVSGNRQGEFLISGWILSEQSLSEIQLSLCGVCLPLSGIQTEEREISGYGTGEAYSKFVRFESFGLLQVNTFGCSRQITLFAKDIVGNTLRNNSDFEPDIWTDRSLRIGASIVATCEKAVIDSRSNLRIAGWAFAPLGLVSIEVEFQGSRLGEASMNGDRGDVAEAFPNEASARRSGFRFSAPIKLRPGAPLLLELTLTGFDGQVIKTKSWIEKSAS